MFPLLRKRSHFKNCSSEYICNRCNGKHHISICENITRDNDNLYTKNSTEKKSKKNSLGLTTTITENKFDTLLMTARSKVSDINSCNTSHARILFDTGIQRSYITEELREKLSLPTIREERIILNTFGEEESKACEVDVVQLKFTCYNGGSISKLFAFP